MHLLFLNNKFSLLIKPVYLVLQKPKAQKKYIVQNVLFWKTRSLKHSITCLRLKTFVAYTQMKGLPIFSYLLPFQLQREKYLPNCFLKKYGCYLTTGLE